MTLTLVQIPGNGAHEVTMPAGATVSDLITEYNLHRRSIYINGTAISSNAYSTTQLSDGLEIFANAAVKGA